MIIRQTAASDYPALKQLWSVVFEDRDAYLELFFQLLPRLGVGFLAESEGRIISAAYLLEEISLPDHKKAAYLYAVATLPEERGQGASSAVMNAVRDYAARQGLVLLTLPAEQWLYDYYGKKLGTTICSYSTTETISADPQAQIEPISRSSYFKERETALAGQVRCSMSPEWFELLEGLCTCYGGGLYRTPKGCCAGYPTEEGLFFVCDCFGSDPHGVCAAAAAALDCACAEYKRTSSGGDPYVISDAAGDFDHIIWNFTLE